jgi:hypothetical protein
VAHDQLADAVFVIVLIDFVMAGVVPAIHVFRTLPKDVDARAGKFTQPAQAWLRAPGMTAEHLAILFLINPNRRSNNSCPKVTEYLSGTT